MNHTYSFIAYFGRGEPGPAYSITAKSLSAAVNKFVQDVWIDTSTGDKLTKKHQKELADNMMQSKTEVHKHFWSFAYDGDYTVTAHRVT